MQGAEGELYMVKANSFQIFQGNLETCSQKKKKKDYFYKHESLSVPDTVTG